MAPSAASFRGQLDQLHPYGGGNTEQRLLYLMASILVELLAQGEASCHDTEKSLPGKSVSKMH